MFISLNSAEEGIGKCWVNTALIKCISADQSGSGAIVAFGPGEWMAVKESIEQVRFKILNPGHDHEAGALPIPSDCGIAMPGAVKNNEEGR